MSKVIRRLFVVIRFLAGIYGFAWLNGKFLPPYAGQWWSIPYVITCLVLLGSWIAWAVESIEDINDSSP